MTLASGDVAGSDVPPVTASDRWRSVLAGLVSFGLLTAAFPPIACAPLVFIAWVPFFISIGRDRARVFWPGFLAGQAFFGGALLFWISSMTTVGAASYAAWAAIAFLHVLFALPLGLILRFLLRRGASLFFAAPVCFAAHSFLRECWTDIAWHDPGYALAEWTRFIQIAEWGGPELLSCLGIAVSAWIAEFRLAREGGVPAANAAPGLRRRALVLVIAIIGFFGYGHFRVNALESQLDAGPAAVGIQPYVTLEERADKRYSARDFYRRRIEATERAVAALRRQEGDDALVPDLVVWPESAFLPIYVGEIVEAGSYSMNQRLRQAGLEGSVTDDLLRASGHESGRKPAFVVGANFTRYVGELSTRDKAQDRHHNSAFFLRGTPNGLAQRGRYDKRTLVPFGESVPFPWLPSLRKALREFIDARAGGFPELTAGIEQPLFRFEAGPDGRELSFVANICYEIVFPHHFDEAREQGADFVVNISNDIWYGDSNEMDLVHQQAQFRALDSRLSILRVSNNGISTIIDPLGRAVEIAESGGETRNVSAILAGRVPVGASRAPWAGWGRWLPILALLGLLAAFLRPKKP